MTLTLNHGPLSAKPPDATNYRIGGPDHRLLFTDFPRRVRALFGGEVVLDSRRGMQLHETGYLPQLYVPESDLRTDLLESTDRHTTCPFKGTAQYWSIRTSDRSDRVAENAVWGYDDPTEAADWLRGYRCVEFEAMDAWFDEDEEIDGHLRDPYHRVDVRASSRHVRVTAGDDVLAETERPMLLSETGLPNRYYIHPDDVRRDRLEPSATHTVCPYKGTASYYSVRLGDRRIADAAFCYPAPLENAAKAADHVCFLADGVRTEVDGERVD
ncbi:DUF427 domain-containing protein [Phytoactinopolyspora halotolerans]|uniref:DUF427 domain-containing protein n=1 Tax=Phytoactinopolyspora halotolerans TaxID=1981512 RepID=A0A6L9SEK9_9ACTN|nr:DUF427 domain-containing protein [Phytoactinopolyspora halotolerans]NEE03028.1 DUF427 domain-containing protein [Phytoactinopolyspora halotolerans]